MIEARRPIETPQDIPEPTPRVSHLSTRRWSDAVREFLAPLIATTRAVTGHWTELLIIGHSPVGR
jgi:hypothetical protein